MNCEINLSWKSGDEQLSVCRDKAQDELWASPLEGSGASVVPKVIAVLDATYADIRAALIAVLPKEMQQHISVVVQMTPEQTANFMADMNESREAQ